MRRALLAIALSFAIVAPALAQDAAKPKYRSAKEIIAAAPASAWRATRDSLDAVLKEATA